VRDEGRCRHAVHVGAGVSERVLRGRRVLRRAVHGAVRSL